MLGEDVNVLPPVRNVKTYARSASWTERSPTKFNAKPKFNSKARASLPPLQPLSINKPSFNDWPTPGSDDLGVWLNSPMPAVKGFLTPREGLGTELGEREVELPGGELAFFNKECSKIVEYIFLGSDAVAKNRDVLLKNGVTHVLNCVGFACPECFKDDFVYKTLWLKDSASEDITSVLYDVFDYFEDVREQGGRVFVHCRQGVSRSTSLVIAYLMWKEEQSFEDAFQYVKGARRVANPNMGFASQLLQCQKRVHALPPTPSSVLRMYRMAPHSLYDPLHLVPKLLDEPGIEGLDSRGAFIVHIPLAIYVWIGKHCLSMLAENAEAAAFQVIRYEKAPSPAVIIKEGEEPSEFWGALGIDMAMIENSTVSQRQVQSYNIDFEIFHKAVTDGVVPPFSFSGDETATRLPAMETGWSRLRGKFVRSKMKDVVTLAGLSSTTPEGNHDLEMADAYEEAGSSSSPVGPSSPSIVLNDSQDRIRPGLMKDSGLKQSVALDPIMPSNRSFTSLESYSRPASSYASDSFSPSNSEISSSFTFSPSSSNGSDLSLSAQPSPSGPDTNDLYYSNVGPLEDSGCLLQSEKSCPPDEIYSASNTRKACNGWPPVKRTFKVLAESRPNISTATKKLPSVDEESENSAVLVRPYSFSIGQEEELMMDAESEKSMEDTEDTLLNSYIELPHRVEEEVNVVVYNWPSMDKVEKPYDALDSGSVYIILISEESATNDTANVVSYVWVGGKVSWKGTQNRLISPKSIGQDVHMWMSPVGQQVLRERGLATDCHIQIIKEDEEPEHLLKYLSYSFQKS
ncbi:hypothetical protein Leryth_022071 [Lithospermum erythrorhizon]|nr:hypothetical protein Leryth_022071 [Lithospermum erythrorhizon]